MCLILTERSNKELEKIKAKAKAEKRNYIIVYKLLRRSNSISKQNPALLYSPYQNANWRKGINKSNRESEHLTVEEIDLTCVHNGLHFFTSYRATAKERQHFLCSTEIWAAKVLIKDIVAIGVYDNANVLNSLVAYKAQLLHRVVKK